MEFDPNDIKNLIINLNREGFYGKVELIVVSGKVVKYNKNESFVPTERPVSEATIKIIDGST